MKGLLLGLGGLLLAAGPVWAAGDSSADVSGFDEAMNESTGLMLQVEINELGEENAASAELRFHGGYEGVASEEAMARAWEEGFDAAAPQIDAEDVASDSSTHGWYNCYSYDRYDDRRRRCYNDGYDRRYDNRSRNCRNGYDRYDRCRDPDWRRRGYYRDYRPTYYRGGYRYYYTTSVYDCYRYNRRYRTYYYQRTYYYY